MKNAMVITMDKQRRILRDGALAIKDGVITDVGKTDDILSKNKAEKIIDASGHLVIPGLVDCHTTTGISLTKGVNDPSVELRLKETNEISFAFEENYTEEDVNTAALGYFVEMIKHGTTCFTEIGVYHKYLSTIANAMKKIGIRGTITKSCRDIRDKDNWIPDSLFENAETNLNECEKLIKQWNGAENGLIKTHVGIRINNNISNETCIKAKEIADKYKTIINAHANMTEKENNESERIWGMRPISRFKKLGVLDKNCLLVHMGALNEYEIDTVKQYGVNVCHCPLTSMFLGSGVLSRGKIPELIQAGVTVGLGNDAPQVGFIDLVRLAHLVAVTHSEVRLKRNMVSAQKALEMATIDGAKAILWDDKIGSIEKGKRADVVLFDMRGMEWHPQIDPVSRLIYSADGSSASTVIIDGKIIMENRIIQTVNEDKIRADLDRTAQALVDKIGIQAKLMWPIT